MTGGGRDGRQDPTREGGPLSRVHLVGIGGAGMSGIARILLARGAEVSGSDARDSRTVLALRAQGARVGVGHDAAHLDQFEADPTAVVVSTAIREDNPELAEARRRGLRVVRRAEALAELMRGHRVVCVAGTHGKTSTTSMLTVALQRCRVDPSFAIGGDLNESGANAHHGTGGIFVAEADESDGSFLVFEPSVAVVTNVEADHLDHHGTEAAYVAVFDEFVDRIPADGVLIVCQDDPGAAALGDRAAARGVRVRRYGSAVTAPGDARILGHRPDEVGGVTTVEVLGDTAGAPATPAGGDGAAADGGQVGPEGPAEPAGRRLDVRLAVPGEHMGSNAVAALLAGMEAGGPEEDLLAGLAGFRGVRRRFEFKGESAGVRVYDDYAHHPTEVRAQLEAVRGVAGQGRLVVVFQPHLYSRTERFAPEFGTALGLADEVFVLDVFGAREEPRPGVTGALIAEAVPLPPEHVHYEPSFDRVPAQVANLTRPGDLVITMGAGDVTMLGPEVIDALRLGGAGTDR